MTSEIDAAIAETTVLSDTLYEKLKDVEKGFLEAKKKYNEAREKYNDAFDRLKKLKEEKKLIENKERIANSNKNLNSDWIDRKFSWEAKIQTLLKDVFKFDELRPQQLAAINATLDCKDVIVVMPTGGGKSLIYQLAAVVDEGLTLVVSPLISLITDQLVALEDFGVDAATIHSGIPKEESKRVYQQMQDPESKMRLLYVTPEWLAKSKRFMGILKKCYEAKILKRVAIDEVHCVSTWGHDFRPDYSYLGIVRSELKKVPFLGLTATATAAVLSDIQETLGLKDSLIITAPFNRPNLFYKLIHKPTTQAGVLDYLENALKNEYKNETGIIYTTTINESVSIAKQLKERNLKVAPYHAQLETDERKSIHAKWRSKYYQAVIATVAFGMGIDKPDVRFVIHHCVPKTMESLYQESGRAGRDGQRADCIILYNLHDYLRILAMTTSLREQKKAGHVLSYCLDVNSCRRELIAEHFDQVWHKSDCKEMCDHCKAGEIQVFSYNIRGLFDIFQKIVCHATAKSKKLTLHKLLDAYFVTGPKKNRLANATKPSISRLQAEMAVAEILRQKYLEHEIGTSLYGSFCYIANGGLIDFKPIKMITSKKLVGIPEFRDKENSNNNGGDQGEPSSKRSKFSSE